MRIISTLRDENQDLSLSLAKIRMVVISPIGDFETPAPIERRPRSISLVMSNDVIIKDWVIFEPCEFVSPPCECSLKGLTLAKAQAFLVCKKINQF